MHLGDHLMLQFLTESCVTSSFLSRRHCTHFLRLLLREQRNFLVELLCGSRQGGRRDFGRGALFLMRGIDQGALTCDRVIQHNLLYVVVLSIRL